LLESEVGFAPVTEVTLAGSGRIARREGGLVLDVGGGRSFTIQSMDPSAGVPPENEDLAIVAALADSRSPDRVILREWKRPAKPGS